MDSTQNEESQNNIENANNTDIRMSGIKEENSFGVNSDSNYQLDDEFKSYENKPLIDFKNEFEMEDQMYDKDEDLYQININEEDKVSLPDDELNPYEVDLSAYGHLFFRLINKRRRAQKRDTFLENIGLRRIAADGTELLRKGNSSEVIDCLLSKFDYKGKYEKINLAYDFSINGELTSKQFDEYLSDCLNLLFEIEENQQKLYSADLNSMGVGISLDDGCLYIIILLAYTPIAIESIRLNAVGRLEIIGKVLEDDKGLYAIKLIDMNEPSVSELVTFQNIIFDLSTLRFVIETDFDREIENPPMLVEFYLKADPESIKYGYKTKIKYLSKAYEVNLKIPLENFPKHSTTQSQLITKSINNSKIFDPVKNVNAVKKSFSIQQHDNFRSASDLESDGNDAQVSDSRVSVVNQELIEEVKRVSSKFQEEPVENSISEFYFEDNSMEDRKDIDMYNDANLRVELETAIHQALQEIKKQISTNKKLQGRLASRWDETGIKVYANENNNDGINEIKYHNALALIHQIRKELETVKGKYDKAAEEMNTKLEEKVANCEKIRKAFNDLKQEISLKACYETTLKKIPNKLLEELENEETAINNAYKQLRFEIIRTRIAIEKNERNIKEQEQLAEGLHLIDFEKLKIENQSLNEKLEERNEEIFKLQKKNNINVQVLSHLKQKLKFEEKEVEELINTHAEKSRIIRLSLQKTEA